MGLDIWPYTVRLLDLDISSIFEEKEKYSLEREYYKHLMKIQILTYRTVSYEFCF